MAQVKIDLSLQDQSSSIKKRTSEVQGLNKELTKSQQLATGTRTGSGAVKASYSPASENAAYGQARGSMGATGASGRDFANQAQGLGGLVRLYATYAANLFAVSAAFQALSNAMDTTNMVRGLDQLGAASGTSLGSLSKDFVKATDGAISFREAMEATAKATSSGMSRTQFLELGDVAKKASQALGVNMSDAVSRLTRGITKLEPELLDELGIFTKVGKATEDYARKVGKAESNLTDFERRQAFANAVIEEGKKKFAEIDIPSNPYAKFLSALKDVGQTILEVINKGVVPLINFLSANPTALLAAIGAIGTMILKQALPAIGQYRSELRKSAIEELELAKVKSAAATKALQASRDAKAKEIQAEKDLIADKRTLQVDAAQKQLESVSKKGLSKNVQNILKTPDVQSISEKDLAVLDKLGSKQTKVSAAYRELASAIRLAQQANTDFANSEKALEAKRNAAPSIFSTAGVAVWKAEQARRSASSKNILSEVGDVAAEKGAGAAFSTLGKQLSTEKLGAVRTAFTGIAGAVSILGTELGKALSVVSRFMGWIGLVIGAYQMLSSAFSKNGAEVTAYEDSMSSLEETTRTAADTAKKYGDALSIDSILAKNTALGGIADTMIKVSNSFVIAKDKASWFDNFTNTIAGWFGRGLEDKLVEQMSGSITAALSVISDPALKKQAEAQILELTGAKSIDQVRSKLESLNKKEVRDFSAKLPAALQNIKTQSDTAAEPLKSLKDAFSGLDKAFLDLSNSLMEKSPITEFASKLGSAAALIQKAMQDPQNATAALNDILKDTTQIKMFPPEVQNSILEAARNMQILQTQANEAQNQIALANSKLAQIPTMRASGVPVEIVTRFELEAQGLLKSATDTYVTATTKMQQLTTNVSRGLTDTVQQSIKLIEAPLSRAIAQANIESTKTVLGLLPKTEDTVKMQVQLELESISLRKQELSQMRELVIATRLLRISNEKKSLEDKLKSPNITKKESDESKQQLVDLEQEKKAYETPKALVNTGEVLSAGAQNVLRQNAGYLAQMEGLAGQERSAKIRGAVEGVGAGFDQQQKNRQDILKFYEEQQKAILENRSLTLEQQQAELANSNFILDALKEDVALHENRKQVAVAQAAIDAARTYGAERAVPLAQSALAAASGQLAVAQATYDVSKQTTADVRDRASIEARTADIVLKQNTALEHQMELMKINSDITSKLQDIRKQELQYLLDTGQISQDKFNQESLAIEKSIRLREKNNALLQLEATFITQINDLAKQLATADATQQENIRNKIINKSTEYNTQVDGINSLYAANNKILEQQNSLADRQKAYSEVFKNSFSSMADALLDWANTGKFAGKDLFNSLIADLARYELRLQTQQMYSSFRPALISGISSLFGGGMSGIDKSIAAFTSSGASLESAKGTAWDYGVQAFAKGGAFTNEIVSSPTMFKFAKGTGLMGEAGPEAIMPLKRDNQGNLGVRAPAQTGGNTQVVVNNYSTEQATTKETTDSKGNRRIEVIVGDAVAREMGRANSPANSSIRNNFQVQPNLVRR
jgi:lambda family phage tail tape measure protein